MHSGHVIEQCFRPDCESHWGRAISHNYVSGNHVLSVFSDWPITVPAFSDFVPAISFTKLCTRPFA